MLGNDVLKVHFGQQRYTNHGGLSHASKVVKGGPNRNTGVRFGTLDYDVLKTEILSIEKQLEKVRRALGNVEASKALGASPEGIAVNHFVDAMKRLRGLPMEALFFAKPILYGFTLQDRVANHVQSMIEVLHTRVYYDLESKRYFNDLRYCLKHVPEVVLNAHADPKDRKSILDYLAMLGSPKELYTVVPFRKIARGKQFAQILLADAIQRGGDLKHKSSIGWTTFHYIAAHGDRVTTELALKQLWQEGCLQPMLLADDGQGKTPVDVALDRLNAYTVPALLQEYFHLAKPWQEKLMKRINEGEYLLKSLAFLPCYENYYKTRVFEELIRLPGIDVNVKGHHGQYPIHLATDIADWELDKAGRKRLKLLLKHPQIDVNVKNNLGFSALDTALYNRRFETMALLLRHPRLNVHQIGPEGKTSIEYAKTMSWPKEKLYLLNTLLLKSTMKDPV